MPFFFAIGEILPIILTALFSSTAYAQWEIEESHTTASLRGIHNVGAGVAWASGTNGTVLRTEDGGYLWQTCAIPPGAEKLDFRGIQAFDENTAIVMSSGPGDQSRLYKTTDGCQTWKLLFTNPDKDGFWDALILNRFEKDGVLLGDPVGGRFAMWETEDKGTTWRRVNAESLNALPGEGAFAASNSSLSFDEATSVRFATGSISQPRVFISDGTSGSNHYVAHSVPMSGGAKGAGIFSMDYRTYDDHPGEPHDRIIDDDRWVAVGGNYEKPTEAQGTAAYTLDSGRHWQTSKTFPHGYRSAVAFEEKTKTWITVGPNGTDISTDDGRNWRPLTPTPQDAPDADKNWNALSLPFVVGPHGRIGKLRTDALHASSLTNDPVKK